MKEIILSARDLCKSYASNGLQNHVLNSVNFDVYKNSFTVIMGASGSGKSTLLYCLSGMESFNSGDLIYQGRNLNQIKDKELTALRRQNFGFIFQQMHLISNLSLLENVSIAGYQIKANKPKEVKDRAIALLKQMNVGDARKRLPSQVSGGEQQRAAIARAMINKPEIIFADEPTGALNSKNTKEVLDLLTNISLEGQTILMVTHDIKSALRADRIIYLQDGRVNGELSLSPYQADDTKSRETQINAWLSSMDW